MTIKIQKKKEKPLKDIFNLIMSRYFILIIIFFMLIVSFFAYKFLIKPVNASINNEINKANEDKKNQKTYLLETLENIYAYKRDYENLSGKNKTKVNLMIPDKSDVGKLFTDIELLVLKNGFVLNSLEINNSGDFSKPRAGKKKEEKPDNAPIEDLGIIELKLDVSNSSYKNFKKLLSVFENNLRILDVYNIDFSPDGSSISFQIKTYYFKQNVKPKNE